MHPQSCFWKLARARRHINELVADMIAWRETDFYRVIRHDNLGQGEDPYISALWKIRILKDVPVTWRYILGDAIGNMRAALDHALYAVITDSSGDLDEKTLRSIQFPVCATDGKFNGAVRSLRPFLSQAQIAVLEEHQPYRAKSPRGVALVNELANRDKHRVPNIVLQFPVSFEFYPEIPGLDKRDIGGKPVHDGQIIATLRTLRPPIEETFELNMNLSVAEHIESDTEHGPMPAAILLESAFEEVYSACAELTKPLHNDIDRTIIAKHIGDSDARWERLRTVFE